MNIKSEQAEAATRALSQVTGESLTRAITVAVTERLHRLESSEGEASDRAAAILALAHATAPRLRDLPDHAELLYDDAGLPR